MRCEFVLEIGFEEVPARHCQTMLKQLSEKRLTEIGEKYNLAFKDLYIQMTPRRLAICAEELKQVQTEAEIKGPLYEIAFEGGKATEVGKKFAESHGVEPKELEKKTVKGKAFVFVKKDLSGELNSSIQSFLDEMLGSISVDRPMRWDGTGIKFSRPIRWIACLFGKKLIPLIYGNVVSEKKSYGPRFLGSPEITIHQAGNYEDELAKHKVIVDHRKRKLLIQRILEKLEKDDDLITDDPQEELLDETTFLTEYPQPILCTFYIKLLDLPADVISTVLIKHQKYFPLIKKDSGEMTNNFLVIANYDKTSDTIKAGNEKVVNARLRDGVFFYEKDRKSNLSEFAKLSEKITFQEKLGSMSEKMKRIEKIGLEIGRELNVDAEKVRTSAALSKADLATNMVTEFPSLEGTMGSVYAEAEGIDSDIANSLTEYYHPRYSEDRLPEGELGTLLALADRIDTLYGLFSLDLQPKGSSDPYGLRRTGIGVMRILWEKELSITLDLLIDAAADAYDKEIAKDEMAAFLLRRLEQYLKDALQKDKALPTDLLRAIVYSSSRRLDEKKRVLDEAADELKNKQFTLMSELAKRIYNLAIKDKTRKDYKIEKSKLNPSEDEYYSAILTLQKKDTLTLTDLYTLVGPATTFFDKNMVMSENADEQARRLEILWLAYRQIQRVLEPEYLLS